MQGRMTPVRRHLPSPRTRVLGGAYRLKEHVVGLYAQSKAQRPVAVVRVEPIVPRLEGQSGSDTDPLMPGARHLKKDLLLSFEQDFPVIDSPGRIHIAVGLNELIARKPFVRLGLLRAVCRKG